MEANNRYEIQKFKVVVNDSEIVFENKIRKSLEIGNMLLLLMVTPSGTFYNENVIGVSLTEKKIMWQIAKLKFKTLWGDTDCPYVDIKYHNGRLYLNNLCDTYLIVDPLTGDILERS